MAIDLGPDGLTLGSTTVSDWDDVGGGKVLQMQTVTKTDYFSTSSTSFTDVTGLSVSITPSSTSNKILVLASVTSSGGATSLGQIRMTVNGSAIHVGDASGSRTQASAAAYNYGIEALLPSNGISFVHSPSSTSAQTYKVQLRNNTGGTGTNKAAVNGTGYDGNNGSYARTASSITVLEIQG